MRPRNLRRRLRVWNRYAQRLEGLGQGRIYDAHIALIVADVERHIYCGSECTHWVEVEGIVDPT